MGYRLIGWAVAVAAAIGIFALAAGNAAAATCDNWTNASGGAWATGANWSTGAPPTSSQSACITIALSAPVVINGSTSIGGLTLGGSTGTDELEFSGSQTFTVGGNSTIADAGVLDQVSGGLTIDQTAGTLTSHGVIMGGDVAFVGNLTNAAGGLILDQGTFDFDGPGTLTNDGVLSVPAGQNFLAPASGATATIINAGSIQNGTAASDGQFTLSSGATMKETTGTTTGSAPLISGGTLDLAGSGASRYEIGGTSILEGTVASAQTVVLDGDASTPGSLTSNGTITGGGTLTVPSGDTLTNDGTILATDNLTMAGNLVNAAAGRLAVTSNSFVVYGPVTLTNEGTITVAPSTEIRFNASSDSGPFGTIDNAGGTIQNAGEVLVEDGQTFDEGAGTTTGSPIQVEGGSLNIQGTGASQFFDNTTTAGTFSGNIAAGQLVEGTLSPTGSFTNSGTLIAGAIHLPTGDTLTNDGTISIDRNQLEMYGNLDNAASGVIGEQGDVLMESPNTSFTNEGTIYLLFSSSEIELNGCGCSADNNQFINSGTIYLGTYPNSQQWGGGGTLSATIAETQSETVDLGGTIVPVPVGEPPPPPASPSVENYGLTGSTGSPPQWTLECGASVGGGWALDCGQFAELVEPSNTSLIPTQISVVGSGTCNSNDSCSSTYGQPVTLTATISAQSGAAPTGSVTFFAYIEGSAGSNWTQVPGDVVGVAPLSTSGGVTTAKLTTILPPGDDYELQAFYPGSATDLAASSSYDSYINQDVEQATTTTTLKASPASPAFGKAVTLTATVTPSVLGPATPTSSVVFTAGNVLLGQAPVKTENGKTTATITTSALLVGSNSVVATYSGDYNYAGSASAAKIVTEASATAPSTVTVTGPTSVPAGSTYTATATTDGTGAVLYSLAANPPAPKGMTISSSSGKVTYQVPSTGVTSFSYAVVAENAAGRAQSAVVTVSVT